MTSEIESARIQLQEILGELEQAHSRGDTFSAQSLREVHSLAKFLKERGYSVETTRNGRDLIVELEPVGGEEEYEWTA